jgi:hypothetical protein
MSEVHVHGSRSIARGGNLRDRIRWICHALRAAAVLWAGWMLVLIVMRWSNKAGVLQGFARGYATDLGNVSDARYGAALAIVLVTWLAVVPIVVCIWKLAGTYLAGRVFALDAAIWLYRTGITATVAIVLGIVARPILASVILMRPVLAPPSGFFIVPQDILHVIFAMFVFALAYIFKAAAEMAEDHAQIV